MTELQRALARAIIEDAADIIVRSRIIWRDKNVETFQQAAEDYYLFRALFVINSRRLSGPLRAKQRRLYVRLDSQFTRAYSFLGNYGFSG